MLELSLGISAWKALGANRWALRCNPSSGNLHPTEGYLVCPRVDASLPGGVHHYVSRDHVLETRARVDAPEWNEAFARGVIVGLSSIHWREAWKYGMRAWRYCQHDCGHAIAAVAYAAAALGWQSHAMLDVSDAECARLLGLSREGDFKDAEEEAPEVLICVGTRGDPDVAKLARMLETASWGGRANRLSVSHVAWPDIASVEAATRK